MGGSSNGYAQPMGGNQFAIEKFSGKAGGNEAGMTEEPGLTGGTTNPNPANGQAQQPQPYGAGNSFGWMPGEFIGTPYLQTYGGQPNGYSSLGDQYRDSLWQTSTGAGRFSGNQVDRFNFAKSPSTGLQQPTNFPAGPGAAPQTFSPQGGQVPQRYQGFTPAAPTPQAPQPRPSGSQVQNMMNANPNQIASMFQGKTPEQQAQVLRQLAMTGGASQGYQNALQWLKANGQSNPNQLINQNFGGNTGSRY